MPKTGHGFNFKVGEKQKLLADDKQDQDESDQVGQQPGAEKMEVDQEEMEEEEDDLEAMMRSYMEKVKCQRL